MNHKLMNLLLFYLIKLDQLGAKPQEIASIHPDPMRRLGHCMWMITKMRSFDWNSDEIKSNRWLGYIQGVLNAERVFSILDLRDHTRPLYNDIPECPAVIQLISDARSGSISTSYMTAITRINFEDIAKKQSRPIRNTKEFASFHTYFNKGAIARTVTEVIFYFKEALKVSMTAPAARRSDHNGMIIKSLIKMKETRFTKMDVEAAKKEIFETAQEELSRPNLDGLPHKD